MINPNKTPNKDIIKAKERIIINLKMKNTSELSELFCDCAEYIHLKEKDSFDHYLMFFIKDYFVFKIYLPNESKDKEFRNIHEALKSVDMQVYIPKSK